MKKITNADFELIIASGAYSCKKLKQIFPEKKWHAIGELFGSFKKQLRKFYPEKNEIEFHRELEKYTIEDWQDVIDESKEKEIIPDSL